MNAREPPVSGSPESTPERIVYVHSAGSNEDIDLRSIWNSLVRDRWILIALSLLGLAGAASCAWLTPHWYRAEVDLLPEYSVAPPPESELSPIDLPASVAERKQLLAVLRSRDFARGFLVDEGLVNLVCRAAGVPPDVESAVGVFRAGISSIREDAETRLLILGIEWADVATAADLANRMATRINHVFRQKAVSEASSNIQSLRSQMAQNQEPDVQLALSRLLESEYQKLALARARDNLAVRIVDPAHPAASIREPNRRMMAAAGLVGGFALGLLVVLVRSLKRGAAKAARLDE